MSNLEIITKEINSEIEKVEIQKILLSTTFKGFSIGLMKTAMFEGMSRGFEFKDFLEKNVYAIPYGTGYSLITSIDYARKIGMRSGVVGVSAPIYVEDREGKILTCSITVKRKISEYVGEYTSTVYFSEYNTGKNQWLSKPRTMIAKVAEMHALRKACPEELSQAYTEEEMQKEVTIVDEKWGEEVNKITTIGELKTYYEKNKGKGKEFDKVVMNHKKFLEQVKKDENI